MHLFFLMKLELSCLVPMLPVYPGSGHAVICGKQEALNKCNKVFFFSISCALSLLVKPCSAYTFPIGIWLTTVRLDGLDGRIQQAVLTKTEQIINISVLHKSAFHVTQPFV